MTDPWSVSICCGYQPDDSLISELDLGVFTFPAAEAVQNVS